MARDTAFPPAADRQGGAVRGAVTILHVALWLCLLGGFWLHWKVPMILGLVSTMANLAALFLPLLGNLIGLVAVAILARRSAGLLNAGLFLAFLLVFQIWTFCVWIEGAAAH